MNNNKQWPVEVTKDLNYEQKIKAEIFNMLSPSFRPFILTALENKQFCWEL